jgi:hypothetical protein
VNAWKNGTYSLTIRQPPAQVQKEVTALIKALPAYNKALKKTNSNDFESLTDADQRDILNAVELSSTFDLAWKGALVSPSSPRFMTNSATNRWRNRNPELPRRQRRSAPTTPFQPRPTS